MDVCQLILKSSVKAVLPRLGRRQGKAGCPLGASSNANDDCVRPSRSNSPTLKSSVAERYTLVVVARAVSRSLTGTNPYLEECVG